MYLLKYRVNIIQYVMIPKSYNFITQRFEEYASLCIIFHLFQVLPTIGFYYQFRFQAYEIDDIGPDDNLAPEFVACRSMGTQVFPELSFSIG